MIANRTIDKGNQVFVDLSTQPKAANIVRRGYTVPPANVDRTQVDKVTGTYTEVNPKNLPRVFSQSIAPGIKVAAGTAVDIVLAVKSQIPIDIFQGTHTSFRGKTVDQFDPIATDGESRRILLTYDNPQDVPAADKVALSRTFAQNGIAIDETKADAGFDAAFNTMRDVMAFQE